MLEVLGSTKLFEDWGKLEVFVKRNEVYDFYFLAV